MYNFLSDAAFGIQQLSLLSVLKLKFPLGITLLLFVPPQITYELFSICQAWFFFCFFNHRDIQLFLVSRRCLWELAVAKNTLVLSEIITTSVVFSADDLIMKLNL